MINSIKETYQDFVAFLKHPSEQPDPIQTRKQKAKRLFSLLIIDMAVMVVLVPVIYGIDKLGLVDSENHQITKLMNQYPILFIILLLVVITPFIEELIFRLYLRFKYNYVTQSILLLSSVTGAQNKSKLEIFLKNFWSKNFKTIFYLSAILFGYVHIFNYEYSTTILLLSPILIATQFVAGLFLGYLRMKYNLVLVYFMHAIHNAIFLIPFIFMMGPFEKLNIKNNDYSIKIEESKIYTGDIISTSSIDSVSFNPTSIKSMIAFLLDKEEMLIESNNKEIVDKKINISFKNYTKDNTHNKEIIMKHLMQVYDFKIERNTRPHQIWELRLQDSLLLAKHQSNTKDSKIITTAPKEIKINNMGLVHLARTLTSSYNQYIVTNIDNNVDYNFKFAKSSFAELKNVLRLEYGLVLQSSEKELEYIHINFPIH
jgi:membrane protease YdiL (CAAX protease family)